MDFNEPAFPLVLPNDANLSTQFTTGFSKLEYTALMIYQAKIIANAANKEVQYSESELIKQSIDDAKQLLMDANKP